MPRKKFSAFIVYVMDTPYFDQKDQRYTVDFSAIVEPTALVRNEHSLQSFQMGAESEEDAREIIKEWKGRLERHGKFLMFSNPTIFKSK